MKTGTTRILSYHLALAALVTLVLHLRDDGQIREGPAPHAMPPNSLTTGHSQSSSHTTRRQIASYSETIPAVEWIVGLKNQKQRNLNEPNDLLAPLEERAEPSEIQMLNLQSHIEGWYSSVERDLERKGRWSWPDYQEIHWSQICESLVISNAQRRAHRVLADHLARQQKRSEECTIELTHELKIESDQPDYQVLLTVPSLEPYHAFKA